MFSSCGLRSRRERCTATTSHRTETVRHEPTPLPADLPPRRTSLAAVRNCFLAEKERRSGSIEDPNNTIRVSLASESTSVPTRANAAATINRVQSRRTPQFQSDRVSYRQSL